MTDTSQEIVSSSPGAEAVIALRTALRDESATLASNSQIYDTALHDHSITSLAAAIVSFVNLRSKNDTVRMISVINLAADLHAPDVRHGEKNGVMAYIVHPLRNTLRLIRFGATDLPLLMASVLHDTVEDHPFELAAKAGVATDDEDEARNVALTFLAAEYGPETARIVEGMSNPIVKDKSTTREEFVKIYLEHVQSATMDPKVFACKVSDFIDNAVRLGEEDQMEPAKLLRMAKKYYPAVQILMARLDKAEKDGNVPLSAQGLRAIREQLEIGRDRLGKAVRSG